jgi:PAS domain S-box-containing protein
MSKAKFQGITEASLAERQVAAFYALGQQLSATKTVLEAGEIIIQVADQLLGWDACSFALYSAEDKLMRNVLGRDTVDGRRVPGCTEHDNFPPSPFAQRVIEEGGQLVLKERLDEPVAGALPFGDKTRPSASILYVPVRDGSAVVGVISLQSYTLQGYDRANLETLQAMADYCAGALVRIRAQEALIESEGNYRLLAETSPDAILVHSHEKIVYVNPAALRLVGAKNPPALLGRSVYDIVPPAARETKSRRIEIAMGGAATAPLEEEILRLDGSSVEVEAISIPFIYRGEPAVQTILRDITGRRSLEQQLRQAQKMEAIGQLAGGVAHDFNNLLAVIRGTAELLMLVPDQHTAETRECLQQINTASERGAGLTRQLLAFSRKQTMQLQPLLLNDVIADLTKMLQRIIGEQTDLQCRYAAHLPCVQADVGMIEQVLVNLAVNGRDAMPRGGQLLVTTEAVTLDEAYAQANPEARAGEFVCLTVKDGGTGISPEHLPRIFEPFFSTKERDKGTGLGLATVHGIVKQHQGWIEVFSRLGEGATFRIFLPAIPGPVSKPAELQVELPLPGGTETILLVEDDYSVRLITRRVLEARGYQVHEAASARQALDSWHGRAEEIALLLSDVVMPEGLTGRELAEQMRASHPALKVVLMSSYSADVVGKDKEFFRVTRTSFLQKPWSARTLLETVRCCLDAR